MDIASLQSNTSCVFPCLPSDSACITWQYSTDGPTSHLHYLSQAASHILSSCSSTQATTSVSPSQIKKCPSLLTSPCVPRATPSHSRARRTGRRWSLGSCTVATVSPTAPTQRVSPPPSRVTASSLCAPPSPRLASRVSERPLQHPGVCVLLARVVSASFSRHTEPKVAIEAQSVLVSNLYV